MEPGSRLSPPLSRNIMHLLDCIAEVRASWARLKSARLAFLRAYPPDKSLQHLTSSSRWVPHSPSSLFAWKEHTDFITCRLRGCALLSCNLVSCFCTLPWWQRRGLNGFTCYHIPSSVSLVMLTVFFLKETFVHNLLKQNIFFLKKWVKGTSL